MPVLAQLVADLLAEDRELMELLLGLVAEQVELGVVVDVVLLRPLARAGRSWIRAGLPRVAQSSAFMLLQLNIVYDVMGAIITESHNRTTGCRVMQSVAGKNRKEKER